MQIYKTLVFTILISFSLSGCGEESTPNNATNEPAENITAQHDTNDKICLLFNEENLGDKGFNDSQYSAAAKVQMEEGFQLIIVTGPRNTLYQSFQKAIKMGCNLLIATEGYAMKDSVLEFAPKYPEKTFILMDEKIYVEYPNLTTTNFKTAEAAYLAGILAADMSTSGVLGIVAGLNVPAVEDFLIGFKQGAKDTKKDIIIYTEYIKDVAKTSNIWSNPNIAAQITRDLNSKKKADVIFSVAGGSNLGTFNAARKLNIKAIGVDTDQDHLSKGVILTSVMKDLGGVLDALIRDYLKGTLESGSNVFGLAKNGVSISPMLYSRHLVPNETLLKITNAQKSIINGKIKVVSVWDEGAKE